MTVTSGAATVYAEDFEDDALGPDWFAAATVVGVGDYARVWTRLCDVDPCNGNNSKQVGFLETDPARWPSPSPDPCDIVNNIGTERGLSYRLNNGICSPVMPLPGGAADGLTLAFDNYWDRVNDTYNPLAHYWGVRSTAGGDISQAPWVSRGKMYGGSALYLRQVEPVGDLLVPGATEVQVMIGTTEYGWCYGCYVSEYGRSVPYFDNVSVKAYPSAGPNVIVTERQLANDGFPAGGGLDLANPGSNSVRFDMAANISSSSNGRNDPGDSLVIDATPRRGATLDMPVMHWTLARRNPLFDPWRTLPANPVSGRVVRTTNGTVIANRYSFDLPDTGMLFPGDVLQYYFAATDHVGGDARTTTAPADLAGFGNPVPQAFPGLFTVRCLPTLAADGSQPRVLFWNDNGFRGGEDEWYGALTGVGLVEGVDYDVFTTHAANSATGVGDGLGGRATVAQIAGYTDLLYTSGDSSTWLLSAGSAMGDRGNDLGLLNGWLTLGGRDVFLTGDNLANGLYANPPGDVFLASVMGVAFGDGSVRDDIGQGKPIVVATAGNPVFAADLSWLAYGGCPTPNHFDAVTALPGAVRLAQFTAADGVSTPYPFAAAVLNESGTNRAISLDHDLMYVMSWEKNTDWASKRSAVLRGVLAYFDVTEAADPSGVPGARPATFAVSAHPNPFNPAVTLRYTLARPGPVTMKVFDARGALVRTLLDGPVEQAAGAVTWDGKDQRGDGVSSGLYFVETRVDGQVDVRKVTMLK